MPSAGLGRTRRSMGEEFVSEPIEPTGQVLGTKMMARGEPGLPGAFAWRGRVHTVVEIQATWKTSSREGGRRDGEMYLRRHWYRVATDTGLVATIYCDRQARNRKRPKARWWMFSVEEGL